MSSNKKISDENYICDYNMDYRDFNDATLKTVNKKINESFRKNQVNIYSDSKELFSNKEDKSKIDQFVKVASQKYNSDKIHNDNFNANQIKNFKSVKNEDTIKKEKNKTITPQKMFDKKHKEENATPSLDQLKEKNTLNYKHNYLRKIFASIFLLFAMTGTAFIAYENKEKQIEVVSLFSGEKSDYEKFITSLVIHDPKPFDKINQADTNTLISASVWRALMAERIREFDNEGLGILKLETVLNAYQELFGKSSNLEIKENIDNPIFLFNADEKMFHIKPYSTQNCFIPIVEDVVENNDLLVLKVGYISPSDPWRSLNDSRPNAPNPTKRMYYKLKKNIIEGKAYIVSVSEDI